LAEIEIDPKRKKIINKMVMLKYFFVINFVSLIHNSKLFYVVLYLKFCKVNVSSGISRLNFI